MADEYPTLSSQEYFKQTTVILNCNKMYNDAVLVYLHELNSAFVAFQNIFHKCTDHNYLNSSVFKAADYAERSKVKVCDWLVKYGSNLWKTF